MTACIYDVAYLCAGLNDDREIIKSGLLEEKIQDFISNELQLYEVHFSLTKKIITK